MAGVRVNGIRLNELLTGVEIINLGIYGWGAFVTAMQRYRLAMRHGALEEYHGV